MGTGDNNRIFVFPANNNTGTTGECDFLSRAASGGDDISFNGSSALSSPNATFTLKARNFPGVNFTDTDTGTATRTSTSPVEAFTEKLDVRVRGRSFALRIDSDALGCKWKLGSPRIDVRQDGRR